MIEPRATSPVLGLPAPDPSSLVRDHPADHSALNARLEALAAFSIQRVAIPYQNAPSANLDIDLSAALPSPPNFPFWCIVIANVYMGYSSYTGGNFWWDMYTNNVTDPQSWGWSVMTPKVPAPAALAWQTMPTLALPAIPLAANGRPHLVVRCHADGPIVSFNVQGELIFQTARQ